MGSLEHHRSGLRFLPRREVWIIRILRQDHFNARRVPDSSSATTPQSCVNNTSDRLATGGAVQYDWSRAVEWIPAEVWKGDSAVAGRAVPR